jgi:hypothetical protein
MELKDCFNRDEGHTLVTALTKDMDFFVGGYDIAIVNLDALARPRDKLYITNLDFAGMFTPDLLQDAVESLTLALAQLKVGEIDAVAISNSCLTYAEVLGVSVEGVDVIQWENTDLLNIIAVLKKKLYH